jgi:Tfp pilus assembly protein PilF
MQPDNADVLDTYGWALHHTGRTTDARNVLERAYAAKPDMFCIHYHLGAVYLAMGDREKAAVHFRRQVERRSTREAARAQEALVRMGAGE